MCALVVMGAATAAAHPHVFIETSLELNFSNGVPDSIQVQWRFDDFFSRLILVDFAGTATGPLDNAQVEQLRVGAFENLADYNYFTAILVNDTPIKITETRDFTAEVDQRALVYTFSIPLQQPGGPSMQVVSDSGEIVIGSYDESFYTFLEFVDRPIRYTGSSPAGVRHELRKRPDHKYYFDLIVPEMPHVTWI